MIILAVVAGLSILGLTAIIFGLIRAVRSTVRDVTPQLRMAPPPKPPQPKEGDDGYLPGPPFAGGSGGTS